MAVRGREERTVDQPRPPGPRPAVRGRGHAAARGMHRRRRAHGIRLGHAPVDLERSGADEPPRRPLGAASVAEVFRAARTASLSAESGHVVGTVTRDGVNLGIDVEGRANGSNQTVFITTPEGGTAEVLTVGDGGGSAATTRHWAEDHRRHEGLPRTRGEYAPVTESDATELGSFTLRTILTAAFAQPDSPVLESDTGRRPRDRGRRPTGLPARPGERPTPVGGRRRQRHPAAPGGAEERPPPT